MIPGYLGIRGILGHGEGGGGGGAGSPHPRMIPGWGRYLGIPEYPRILPRWWNDGEEER